MDQFTIYVTVSMWLMAIALIIIEVPLTVRVWRNSKMPKKTQIVILVLVWVVLIAFFALYTIFTASVLHWF